MLPYSNIDRKLGVVRLSLDEVIKNHVLQTYETLKGNRRATADVLNISPCRLDRLLKIYQVLPPKRVYRKSDEKTK